MVYTEEGSPRDIMLMPVKGSAKGSSSSKSLSGGESSDEEGVAAALAAASPSAARNSAEAVDYQIMCHFGTPEATQILRLPIVLPAKDPSGCSQSEGGGKFSACSSPFDACPCSCAVARGSRLPSLASAGPPHCLTLHPFFTHTTACSHARRAPCSCSRRRPPRAVQVRGAAGQHQAGAAALPRGGGQRGGAGRLGRDQGRQAHAPGGGTGAVGRRAFGPLGQRLSTQIEERGFSPCWESVLVALCCMLASRSTVHQMD